MFKINSLNLLSLSIGLSITVSSSVYAHTTQINNLTEFYDYYGEDFTSEQKTIIEGLFANIEPYFGPEGLNNAKEDGFIPLTPDWEKHGVHWFNYTPEFIDITNMQANPLKPAGLNFTYDGQLAAVFWAQELYAPLVPLFQTLQQTGQLENLTPSELTEFYIDHKENTETLTPTIFNMFPDAFWHKHKDAIIENVNSTDVNGNLDPQQVNFRQSIPEDQFILDILASLADPDSVLFPLEPPVNSNPPFNRGVSAGFHMIHLWVGQGNHDGPWAGTNPDVPISAEAISESITFEDGSGGHDHDHGMGGGHGHDGSQDNAQSTPEPTSLLSLILITILGSKFKKKFRNPKF